MATKKRTTRKSSPKKATKKTAKKKLENLNSTQEKSSSKNESSHGGAREGAGRKPGQKADQARLTGLKEMAELHAMEEVEVPMMVSGVAKMVKMTRNKAILEMLFGEAVKNKNVAAAREYGDRTRGRARQEIDLSGEIPTADQYTPEDPALKAASQAYAEYIKKSVIAGQHGE